VPDHTLSVTRKHAGVPGMQPRGLDSEYDPFGAAWNVVQAP